MTQRQETLWDLDARAALSAVMTGRGVATYTVGDKEFTPNFDGMAKAAASVADALESERARRYEAQPDAAPAVQAIADLLRAGVEFSLTPKHGSLRGRIVSVDPWKVEPMGSRKVQWEYPRMQIAAHIADGTARIDHVPEAGASGTTVAVSPRDALRRALPLLEEGISNGTGNRVCAGCDTFIEGPFTAVEHKPYCIVTQARAAIGGRP